MAIVHFCKDVHFDMSGREYQMTQEISAGLWQVREVRTGRMHEFRIQELQQCYAEGKLVFMEDADKVNNRDKAFVEKTAKKNRQVEGKEWDKAVLRRMYVKAVEHLPCTRSLMEPAIQKVWAKLELTEPAPHWTTVSRWKKKYLANGKDAFALAEEHHRKGNRSERIEADVIEIAENCIDKIYMKRERGTIEETVEEVVVMITRENNQRPSADQLSEPTRRLIKRLIDAIPAFDRYVARHGKVAAHRLFRSKLKHLITKKPLEAAEIDHTKLDLFVIDDESHIPLGRPWLTICIDTHTRCILGIYIGFEPPSYLTVGKCLKHAILPKVNLQQQFPDIRHIWEAHGVMEQLFVDNGLEFHSISLEKACFAFGVEIVYTPRKTPWFKGKIERFNRTINKSVSHGIPGTTFSNIFEKDDYDPAKHAVVTLSTLRLIIHKWIADYYHQKPHRGLEGVTPAVMWTSSIKPEDIALAHNPAEIDMLLGKAVMDKTVSHKGIEINNLLYNSPELMQLRRLRGDTFKVEIRVDETDIGHLFVMLDNGQYLEVPALDFEYSKGMTLWLHDICRAYAKKNFKKTSVYSYALAKTEIREIVENELKLKRKKSNSKVGRYQDTAKPVEADTSVAEVSTQKTKAAIKKAKPALNKTKPLAVMSSKPRPSYAPIIDARK
jgi:putative transposase